MFKPFKTISINSEIHFNTGKEISQSATRLNELQNGNYFQNRFHNVWSNFKNNTVFCQEDSLQQADR